MKEVTFVVFPFVKQTGSIMVPDNCEFVIPYVYDHFKEANLSEPDYDYTDVEIHFDF